MLLIVDYDLGNIGSLLNMFKKIGIQDVLISSFPEDIKKADKLVLPGVGAFDNGMKNLKELGLISLLNDMVLEKQKPILGVCLGMQLFTKASEEGVLEGLSWIDATTRRFNFENNGENLRVPHMGWNTVKVSRPSPLLHGIDETSRFYFVHSYRVVCNHREDVLLETHYGMDFTSAFHKNNIYGVQFHPEKSHRFGMQLLENFSRI
ncbi:MAG: imidazole glycerol phosphate synthase subunit HisH [Armatimonadetes bacterium]|nr:imidazole glycerol phosphate synthase subunit HisH [Armatimonadota bacterium]